MFTSLRYLFWSWRIDVVTIREERAFSYILEVVFPKCLDLQSRSLGSRHNSIRGNKQSGEFQGTVDI